MRPATVSIPLVLLAACAGGDDGATPDAPDGPTWYRDVAPILSRHCMSCHRDGGIAPFSMQTYEQASPVAPMLLDAVESGLMPPWDAEASADCTPRHAWKDDPRLTADETDVLRAWIATGRALGDEAAIPPPPTTDLAGVTHTAAPSTPYVTTGANDEFICYLLDPRVTTDSWMTGIQVVPGNPKVVHHAVLLAARPGAGLDALRQARGVGRPWPCAAGDVVSTPETTLMGVWTPGSQPFVTPDLGLPIPAGAMVVMQMHYHPGGAPSNAPDASTVRLRLQTTRPARAYAIGAIGNASAAPQLQPDPDDRGAPEFRIPANATAHVETMRFPISGLPATGAQVFAAYPHMHYIGVELSVQVERPLAGGVVDRECLVNVPRWNFDWQRTYQYDAPIAQLPTVYNGDIVTVRCRYDNSLANPFVRRALAERGLVAPIDVSLGEQSLDEMCVGIFGVVAQP